VGGGDAPRMPTGMISASMPRPMMSPGVISIEIACLDTAPGRVYARAPARSPSCKGPQHVSFANLNLFFESPSVTEWRKRRHGRLDSTERYL
jgi:hypothetical protein